MLGSPCRIRDRCLQRREIQPNFFDEKYCIIGAAAQGGCDARDSGMGKAKKRVFSIVKAVKQNARDRVGTVPAERVIPDPKQKAAAKPKYKETLANLLSGNEADE
jgi:hypothetical protein